MFSLYHMLFQIAIEKEKILNFALMGYSAGGHLALLYAYKAAKCASCPYNDNCGYGDQANENCPYDKHKVSPAIPIELVISEAGPTNFVQWDEEEQLILPDNNTCAMAGVMNDDTANVKEGKLEAASPINYIDANAPYTILAYGNGVGPFQGITTYTGTAGDGIIPYAHATAVYTELGSGKCSFFELNGINHNQFGEGSGKVVYPNTDVNDEELNQIIDDYYEKISSKLQELAQQED